MHICNTYQTLLCWSISAYMVNLSLWECSVVSDVKRNHTRYDSNYPINLRHVDAIRILVVNCSYFSLISLRMENSLVSRSVYKDSSSEQCNVCDYRKKNKRRMFEIKQQQKNQHKHEFHNTVCTVHILSNYQSRNTI